MSEVSEARPGQRFAFVMDTRLCDAVYALADGVDMLVIEATFLVGTRTWPRATDTSRRGRRRVAAECGVRRLVLTHFSQRYTSTREHHDEAAEVFAGDLVIAEDLARIRVPERL